MSAKKVNEIDSISSVDYSAEKFHDPLSPLFPISKPSDEIDDDTESPGSIGSPEILRRSTIHLRETTDLI